MSELTGFIYRFTKVVGFHIMEEGVVGMSSFLISFLQVRLGLGTLLDGTLTSSNHYPGGVGEAELMCFFVVQYHATLEGKVVSLVLVLKRYTMSM